MCRLQKEFGCILAIGVVSNGQAKHSVLEAVQIRNVEVHIGIKRESDSSLFIILRSLFSLLFLMVHLSSMLISQSQLLWQQKGISFSY